MSYFLSDLNWKWASVARKHCPRCKVTVEEKVIREGNKVTKVCPNCGFIFVSYEIGKGVLIFNNEPVPDTLPNAKPKSGI
ncbi:MAG: zinc ribbon domain-containing protein [Sulfolobales archaeon]|nr:zinc ribbon domain-containing protein [Sulfolobales archaeon]